jgi:hypothetical protein
MNDADVRLATAAEQLAALQQAWYAMQWEVLSRAIASRPGPIRQLPLWGTFDLARSFSLPLTFEPK